MHRLPEGWSAIEVVEDVIVADGVELRRAGLAAVSPTGEEIAGSAADDGRSPMARAGFELLERVAILEAARDRSARHVVRDIDGAIVGDEAAAALFPESPEPNRWRPARSNGVALHGDWARATTRARWELVERDRVLRAWYGETLPVPIDRAPLGAALGSMNSYEFCAYELPAPVASTWSVGVQVVGVFGFPKTDDVPFVAGYGGRATQRAAVAAAVSEALQVLAFLWGETIPDRAPAMTPTPGYHLESMLWRERHAVMRAWLDGAHRAFRDVAAPNVADQGVRYADLTPAWMPDGMRVAKVLCDAAAPLAFGDAPYSDHLPGKLRVHPIA